MKQEGGGGAAGEEGGYAVRCQSAPENAIYVDPVLTQEAEIKCSDVPPLPTPYPPAALWLITTLSLNCWVDSWQPVPQRRLG